MGRAQILQGDLLALMQPGPTLPPATRATLIPPMVALLLEAVAAEAAATAATAVSDAAAEREAGDEQDHA